MSHLIADLFVCDKCKLISSDLIPDEQIYDVEYYTKYVKYENSDLNKALQNARREVVLKYVKSGNLLDFGCGSGAFLRAINGDLIAEGFDINPYTGKLNFSNLFDSYRAVTFWDSLEHIKNPKKLIKSMDSDYIFVCTPSTDDIKKRGILEWRHYRPKEHIHYFNEESLRKLFYVCGYDLVEKNYKESRIRRGGRDKNLITAIGVKNAN